MAAGVCRGPECERAVHCRGVCEAHYRHLKKKRPLTVLRGARKPCSMADCEKLSHAQGLCPKHYNRLRVNGAPDRVTRETAEAVAQRVLLGVKTCPACGELKAFDDYYRSKASPDGCANYCKLCSAPRQSAWHKANAEANRQRSHARRELERTGVGIDIDLLWSMSDGRCPDCGTAIYRSAKFRQPGFGSVDHIVPLSKGGAHSQDNVRLTCLPCNLSKGAKIITTNTKEPAHNG